MQKQCPKAPGRHHYRQLMYTYLKGQLGLRRLNKPWMQSIPANNILGRSEVDWVSFFCGHRILLPHLYRLISLTCDKAAAGAIKGHRKDACFRLQGARLRNCLALLEAISGAPVPEPAAV
jgi:hypothetical protein